MESSLFGLALTSPGHSPGPTPNNISCSYSNLYYIVVDDSILCYVLYLGYNILCYIFMLRIISWLKLPFAGPEASADSRASPTS